MVSVHECSIISQILDANPIIYEWGLQDRIRKITHTGVGAEGMSAEQVQWGRTGRDMLLCLSPL